MQLDHQLLQLLDESHRQFFAAIDGLTEAQWVWKPAPGRWSIGETAEHIVLAENRLFGGARRAMAAPRNPDWETQTQGKTELLLRVLPARQGKAISPDPILPHQALTRSQVEERFVQQRAAIVGFAQAPPPAWQEHTSVHPFPKFGTLNAYQWLLYVPLHTIRHNRQIAEVKATAGYPAG